MFFNRRPKRDDKVRNTVARNIFALSFVYLFAKKIFVERAACKKADATVQRKYVHILPINCFPRWPRRLASAMGINVYSTSEQRETLLQEFWLGQQRLERRFPEVSLPMYVRHRWIQCRKQRTRLLLCQPNAKRFQSNVFPLEQNFPLYHYPAANRLIVKNSQLIPRHVNWGHRQ